MDAFELGIQAGMEKTAFSIGGIGTTIGKGWQKVKSVLGRGGTGVPGSSGAGTMGPKTLQIAPPRGTTPLGPSASYAADVTAVEKATGLKGGQLSGQLGKLTPDQLSSVSQAQKGGLITTDQAQAIGKANRAARQEQLAADASKNITQSLSGKTQMGPVRRGLRNVGYAAGIGIPVAAIASGAGEGMQQATMPQQY